MKGCKRIIHSGMIAYTWLHVYFNLSMLWFIYTRQPCQYDFICGQYKCELAYAEDITQKAKMCLLKINVTENIKRFLIYMMQLFWINTHNIYIPFCIFGIFFELSSWRPLENCEAYLVTWSVRFVLNIFGFLAQYRRYIFFFSMFISTKQNLRRFWCWSETLQFCLSDVNMTGANTLRKGLRIWHDFFKESMMACWHRHARVIFSYSTPNCI